MDWWNHRWPILSFLQKNGFNIAIGILGFVFLFKVGEAFLGRMSIVFYKEIGFSKSDIAIYSKTLGWITTVIFTLLGGLFVIRSGVLKAMFVAGINNGKHKSFIYCSSLE